MQLSNTVKGFANRWVSATSFGLIPLFSIPVMATGMHLSSMMVYRFAFGCLGILAVLLWKRVDMKLSLIEFGEICLLALFYDTEALLMILGYNYIPSGVATTLVFSYPIWTELLMLIFFHERFSLGTLGAMTLAIMGVACMSNMGGDGSIHPLGVVIEMAAGFSYALYMVSMSHMRVRRMGSLKLTFYVFLIGALFFVILSFFFFDGIRGVDSTDIFVNLALLGVVSTALSNVMLIPAIKQIGATMTAILGAFEPLTAMIISILVFGDTLTPGICIGFVFIISAVLLLIFLKMRRLKHNRLLGLLICAFLPLSAFAQQRKPRPITFDTDTPFVHDPVMAYEDGVYYAFYTGWNIGCMTSTDRSTWNVKRDGLLKDIPAWTHDSVPGFERHVWAPDVIRWRNRWWMAYSCSTFGKNTSAIGLLSASTLALADWQDEGCLVASKGRRDNWNAIDPAFVVDRNDTLWMAWGSFWDGIQMAPLAMCDGRLQLAGYPRTIARRYYRNAPEGQENPTSRQAGVNAIEAPFILHQGGYYYLFVSWDYCCRGEKSTYRVVVGRSKEVYGPYVDREGRPMYAGGGTPVIAGDGTNFEAAGHCAAYHFPDGDTFVCHGYSIPLHGQSILVQRRMVWEDGWPKLR